jgi:hypothetical protein
MSEYTQHTTVNLSHTTLTDAEYSLLNKGLTFIPTYNKMPIDVIYKYQMRLIRNLKLKDYYQDTDNSDDYDRNIKTFTEPSSWTPADHRIGQPTLDTIQHIVSGTESVLNRFTKINNRSILLRNSTNNLSIHERNALNSLKNNADIVIKPADKGSATVVISKYCYLTEAYRQLNNTHYYRRIDHSLLNSNVEKINDVLAKMRSERFISEKQHAYLMAKPTDRGRVFYLLPKIHKPVCKWPQPGRMPEGRPIVSDTNSESYRISKYIDYFIRPISIKHSAYLKDTYDFISKVRDRSIPTGCILVTGDVSALYTNMETSRTIRVVKEAMEKYPNDRRPDKHLLQLLDITLKNNDFSFNNEMFLQITGTAMGKAYAPSLADLYMQEIDERASANQYVDLLFRFLDDIFFVWTGSVQDLKQFETYLNSLVPGIHITLQYSEQEVNFLDTTVYINNNVLNTKVFFKPTDTHQLLHKLSFHPKHTATGVLKSQFLRFKRISSTRQDYDDACRILSRSLRQRHYSARLLRKIKLEVWTNAAQHRVDKSAPILPVIVPYNSIGTQLSFLWRQSIASNSLFNKFNLITAYTVGKNLRKHLVSSSLEHRYSKPLHTNRPRPSDNIAINGCNRCPSIKCKACNRITVTECFSSTTNGKTFRIIGNINCKTANIIYLITCKKCKKQYVGETSRTLADRTNDHLSCIRLGKPTPTGLHFNSTGHSIADFSITAIEKFDPATSTETRRIKEATWQQLLQTTHPYGINNLKQRYVPIPNPTLTLTLTPTLP